VRSQLIGKPFSLFLSSGDAVRFSDHLHQCWTTHENQTIELNLRLKGEVIIPVQLSTIAAEVPEKADWICRTVLTDITGTKHSAEALRLSEESLRIALETAHIVTWDWNIIDDQVAWGGQSDELFGATAKNRRGSYEEFTLGVHPEDREMFEIEMHRAVANAAGCQFEFRVNWPDGSLHWIQAQGQVLTDASGKALRMIGVLMETTFRREAEAQLRKAHHELERRVTERTAELARAISALQQEVVERKEAQEGRQRLFRELVTAQEEERRRISRELHDQMGQHLTALILGLKSIQGALQSDTQLRLLRDLQNLTDDIGQQVHRIAFELRPTALDDLGLSSMLLNYMDEWSARFGIGVDFHSGGLDQKRLPTEIETTIYRIIQEALTNVVKHAEASHLSLILVRGEDHLLAIIEDNGKGFDVDKLTGSISGPHHLGLLGMKERVALAGGTFELESSVGRGVTLFIRIPCS
jgi:signal transduction histidine kinase